eukprot:EG_transcript_19872
MKVWLGLFFDPQLLSPPLCPPPRAALCHGAVQPLRCRTGAACPVISCFRNRLHWTFAISAMKICAEIPLSTRLAKFKLWSRLGFKRTQVAFLWAEGEGMSFAFHHIFAHFWLFFQKISKISTFLCIFFWRTVFVVYPIFCNF